MKTLATTLLAALALPACIIPPDAQPNFDLGANAVTQYNFRGVPFDEDGAFQGDMTVTLPTKFEDSTIVLNVFANVAISDDNDGGFLGEDNGLEISRADYTATYAQPLGDMDFTAGITQYTFPGNARPFFIGHQFDEGTTSFFGTLTWDILDLSPTVEVFYDVDVAGGIYINGHISRTFDWKDDIWFEARAGLGVAEGGYAEEYYGDDEFGLADFSLSGSVQYQLEENLRLEGILAFSTVIDSSYDDALDLADIDTSNFWLGVGANWSW